MKTSNYLEIIESLELVLERNKKTNPRSAPFFSQTSTKFPYLLTYYLPFVILNWAADAFFWFPTLGVSPSFFCCFKENSFIIVNVR